MECDRNVLTSIIQRMQVVAGAVDISPVRLTLTGDRLLCYTASPDAGEAEEEVEVDHDGGAASVVLNTRRMLEVMRRVPGARIRMELTDDPNRAVFFLPGDAESESMKNTLLLMPVRQDAPQVAGWKPVAST
jgi:DNA polymerase III sliding clamp (beta) subunit (PCNA family)